MENDKWEMKSALNPKPRNRRLVFFRVWIGKQASFELVELPNFQVGQITKDGNVTENFRTLSQQRMNQESTLPVDRGLLTLVVRSVKELSACLVHRW